MSCAVSGLDWKIGCVTPPSVIGLSTGGLGVLTVVVRKELAFADTMIVKTSRLLRISGMSIRIA
jgi:hypothetical protein